MPEPSGVSCGSYGVGEDPKVGRWGTRSEWMVWRMWGSVASRAQVVGLGLPPLDPAALRSMMNTTGEVSLRRELEYAPFGGTGWAKFKSDCIGVRLGRGKQCTHTAGERIGSASHCSEPSRTLKRPTFDLRTNFNTPRLIWSNQHAVQNTTQRALTWIGPTRTRVQLKDLQLAAQSIQ